MYGVMGPSKEYLNIYIFVQKVMYSSSKFRIQNIAFKFGVPRLNNDLELVYKIIFFLDISKTVQIINKFSHENI